MSWYSLSRSLNFTNYNDVALLSRSLTFTETDDVAYYLARPSFTTSNEWQHFFPSAYFSDRIFDAVDCTYFLFDRIPDAVKETDPQRAVVPEDYLFLAGYKPLPFLGAGLRPTWAD